MAQHAGNGLFLRHSGHKHIAALAVTAIVSVGCLAAAGPAEAVLFGSQSQFGDQLYTIETTGLSPGAGTPVGAGMGAGVNGIAVQPGTGTLFGATEGDAGSSLPANTLVTINTTSGAGTIVGPFMLPRFVSIGDLAFDPLGDLSLGDLYGWSTAAGNDLHKINVSTGQATLVGLSGLSGVFGSGLAFRADGVLYLAAEGTKGKLRTVDKLTGLTTVGPTLHGFDICGCPKGEGIVGLSFNGPTLYGVTNNSDHLITIDVTGSDPGLITDKGPAVGPDVGIEGLAFTDQVVDQVPEPAALLLTLSGVAALIARRGFAQRRRAARLT
jgi:hypothetical protein